MLPDLSPSDYAARPHDPALPARRTALWLGAFCLLLVQLPACATQTASHRHPVAMSIVDRESGLTLAEYRKDGRSYVAGRPASRYAVRLTNRSGGRVLVVLSVDGVNVVSGETAAVGQTGYVLGPGQSYDIAGWRKSDTAVAAFVFAALADSYAARTGRADNVGVIGMAVFLEKPVPPLLLPQASPPTATERSGGAGEPTQRAQAARQDSAARGSLQSGMADRSSGGEARAALAQRLAEAERLGTAHGQREWSVTRRTTFERLSSAPQDVVEIAYDSHANLVLAGVIPAPLAQARAFPRDDPRAFVPDPPPR